MTVVVCVPVVGQVPLAGTQGPGRFEVPHPIPSGLKVHDWLLVPPVLTHVVPEHVRVVEVIVRVPLVEQPVPCCVHVPVIDEDPQSRPVALNEQAWLNEDELSRQLPEALHVRVVVVMI